MNFSNLHILDLDMENHSTNPSIKVSIGLSIVAGDNLDNPQA